MKAQSERDLQVIEAFKEYRLMPGMDDIKAAEYAMKIVYKLDDNWKATVYENVVVEFVKNMGNAK